MRAIAVFTAAVLVVIGIGVGVESTTVSPADATITGVVRVVGGASARPGYFNVVGTVTATGSSGATYATTSSPDGVFSLELPPGTYLVAATSLSVQDGSAVSGPRRLSLAPAEKVRVKFAFQIP